MDKQRQTSMRDLMRILLKRWKLLLGFALLGLILGIIQYKTTVPAFGSSSKVLVERPSGFAITAATGFGGLNTSTNTKQQLQFVQSEPYRDLATAFGELASQIPLDLTDFAIANNIGDVIRDDVLKSRQVTPVRLMMFDRPASALLAFEQEQAMVMAPKLTKQLDTLSRMAMPPDFEIAPGWRRGMTFEEERTSIWPQLDALANSDLVRGLEPLGVTPKAASDLLAASAAPGSSSSPSPDTSARLLDAARLRVACEVVGILNRLDDAQRPKTKPLFSLMKTPERTGPRVSEMSRPQDVIKAAGELITSPAVSRLLKDTAWAGRNLQWAALGPQEKLELLRKAGEMQWVQDRKSPPEKRDTVWAVSGREMEEGSDIVQITQTAPSADEARRGANAYAMMVVWKDRMTRVAEIERNIRFLAATTAAHREALRERENDLLKFRRRTNLVDIPTQLQMEVGKYGDFERSRLSAETDLAATKASLKKVQEQLDKLRMFNVANTISQNPLIATTKAALFSAEATLAEMQANYKDDYPPLQAQKASVEQLRKRLEEQTQTVVQEQELPNPVYADIATRAATLAASQIGLEARASATRGILQRLDEKFKTLPSQQAEFVRLTRAQQLAERLYLGFYDRWVDAVSSRELRQGNARVVELATEPGKKAKPRLRFIIVATILGVFFGSLCALALSSSDTHLRTPEDVQRELDLPVLAHLPRLPGGNTLVVESQPASAATEAIRALRSTLRFKGGDKPLKTVAATSARTGEGKSTLVANLAASLAQSGLTVTAVDADLRRPRLASFFGLPLTPGLSDALGGRDARQVRAMTRIPGLWVVPAGQTPSNPGELLDNGRVERAIKEFVEACDFVLVDTPPIGVVTDAALVGSAVDATIIVLESGTSEPDEVRKAVARLTEHARANVVGVVLIGGETPVSDEYIRYVTADGNGSGEHGARRGRRARHN